MLQATYLFRALRPRGCGVSGLGVRCLWMKLDVAEAHYFGVQNPRIRVGYLFCLGRALDKTLRGTSLDGFCLCLAQSCYHAVWKVMDLSPILGQPLPEKGRMFKYTVGLQARAVRPSDLLSTCASLLQLAQGSHGVRGDAEARLQKMVHQHCIPMATFSHSAPCR